MSKHELRFSEATEKHIKIIQSQMRRKMDLQESIEASLSFVSFMLCCAKDDELFMENLNNVMGLDDFLKFFTGEPNDV